MPQRKTIEPGGPEIGFEPLGAHHFPMLRAWLDEEHVRRWWGDPEEEIALIREGLHSHEVDAFVASIDGQPVAYVQSWVPGTYAEVRWGQSMDAGAAGVDIFIGPVGETGKGHAARILKIFAERLLALGHPQVVIDPDAENTRAIRAYEKAGFRPLHLWEEEDGSTLLMIFDRQTSKGGA